METDQSLAGSSGRSQGVPIARLVREPPPQKLGEKSRDDRVYVVRSGTVSYYNAKDFTDLELARRAANEVRKSSLQMLGTSPLIRWLW